MVEAVIDNDALWFLAATELLDPALDAFEALSRELSTLDSKVLAAVEHRIISLLYAVSALCETIGVHAVQKTCLEAGVAHKTIRSVLGSRFDSPLGSVREALASFLRAERERAAFKMFGASPELFPPAR